ncbi:signal transducer [Salix suchowensis]|nr:signal transducer [Salix suchowensis]
MAAIQSLGEKSFNKFLVHYDTSLVSYSLDLLTRVALLEASKQALDASLERIAAVILVLARGMSCFLSMHSVLEAVDVGQLLSCPSVVAPQCPFGRWARPYEVVYSPWYNADFSLRSTASVAMSQARLVPDFSSSVQSPPMADLKEHTLNAKPLGLVRSNDRELLVIYDTLGCYISKHGVPQRKSGYIKWETQAASYAHRGPHILLFSASFIEVREIESARLVQVIEGNDIRLLYSGPLQGEFEDVTLVAMKNDKDDTNSKEKVVALEPTVAIQSSVATPASSHPGMWDEWDM